MMNKENIGKSLDELWESLKVGGDDRNDIANKIADETIQILNEKISKEEILIELSIRTHKMLDKNLELNSIKSDLAVEIAHMKFETDLINAIKSYTAAYSGKIGYQRMRGQNNEK
jgi:hypothetical protein